MYSSGSDIDGEVWSTIAIHQGGMVAGYTAGAFAAYYIVWTLVRNMNIVFTPYGWEGRIQRGQLLLLEAFGGGFTWGSALVRY